MGGSFGKCSFNFFKRIWESISDAVSLGLHNCDLLAGFVCQKRCSAEPHLLHFSPQFQFSLFIFWFAFSFQEVMLLFGVCRCPFGQHYWWARSELPKSAHHSLQWPQWSANRQLRNLWSCWSTKCHAHILGRSGMSTRQIIVTLTYWYTDYWLHWYILTNLVLTFKKVFGFCNDFFAA